MSEKKNWNVTMRCVVEKDVYLENCTEEEAKESPWTYAIDEQETQQIDWEIKSIQEDK